MTSTEDGLLLWLFLLFLSSNLSPFFVFPHSSLLIFLVFSQGTHVLNFLLCISSRKFCPWSHWLLNIFTCLNNISNSVLDLYIYFTYTSNSLLLNQTQPPKLVLLHFQCGIYREPMENLFHTYFQTLFIYFVFTHSFNVLCLEDCSF